jgi:hypothetical protein
MLLQETERALVVRNHLEDAEKAVASEEVMEDEAEEEAEMVDEVAEEEDDLTITLQLQEERILVWPWPALERKPLSMNKPTTSKLKI